MDKKQLLDLTKNFFTWGAIIAGFAAAALWLRASTVKVVYRPQIRDDGYVAAATIDEDGDRQIDVVETAKEQARWNKRAALVTGVAVFAK